jgi:deoxyribose-phosphate aldolase
MAGTDYRPPNVPPVDQVGVEERAAKLQSRSIKRDAKVAGMQMVVSMIDLTTLEGSDTPGKVRML